MTDWDANRIPIFHPYAPLGIHEGVDEIKDSVLKNMAQPAKLDGSQHVDDSQGFGDPQVCHSQPEEKPAGPISKKAKTEI